MTPVSKWWGDKYWIGIIAVFLFLCDTSKAYGLELGAWFKRPDQRAVELLEDGQAEAAANEFTDPKWRGVSRYRAGLYKEAMEDFSALEDAKGLYNHGTAATRAGDYTQAVTSLEQALQLAPEDTDIAHNLEIARKLKDMAEDQQQQDQSQGDQNQEKQQESESDSSESDQPSDSSDNQEGEQEDRQPGQQDEQNQSENSAEGQSEAQENSGEMNSSEQDQPSENQQEGAEDLREMMQQEQLQQADTPQTTENQQQIAAADPESVSEDDQATEQWLRRIPDDASQLLRNKIRLNHLIEYPQVDDMQEPW